MTDVISYPAEHEPESLKKTMEWIRNQYIAFHDIHLSYLGLTVEDLSTPPELKFNREYVYFRLIRTVAHHLDDIFERELNWDGFGRKLSEDWFEQEIDTNELAHLIVNHGSAAPLSDIFFSDWFAKREREQIPTITWLREYEYTVKMKDTEHRLLRIQSDVNHFINVQMLPTVRVYSLLLRLIDQQIVAPPSPREDLM